MAKRFSIGETALAGWGLVRREPKAVAVWGLVLLVFLFGPMVAVLTPIMLEFGRLASDLEGAQGTEAFDQAIGLQLWMMLFNLVSTVVQLVVQSVVIAAVFRAVLEPDNRGRFRLRLGAQEAWLMLLVVIGFAIFYIGMVLVMIAGLAIGGLFYFVAQEAGAFIAGGLVILVGTVALLWVGLRLSMAGPMSFAERKLRLFESWTLTKGSSLRLLGMSLLNMLTLLVAQLVVVAVLAAPFLLWVLRGDFSAFVGDEMPAEGVMRRILLFVAIASPLSALLQAVLLTVMAAPWAAAYKALVASAPMGPDAPVQAEAAPAG